MEDIDKAVQAEVNKNDAVKKPPRKPRPSEIAAKLAKAAKKTKPKAKPKAKKKIVKKAKHSKPKAKKKVHGPNVIRTERMDLRLTKQEKASIMARSKKTKKTVTGVVMEAVHQAKW